MIGAIVRNDMVENLIILDDAQKAELEAALSCEIVDARPYGLIVGDLRTAAGWTRNAGGEQTLLPLLEQESYDSYTLAINRAIAAEEQLDTVSNDTADEALAIINGEVTE